jgi:hypothetical protein
MAQIAYQQVSILGIAANLAAATGGGDTIAPSDRGALVVKNGDASSKTVTIVTPGNDKYGQARPDIAVVVAAGATELIGPLPQDLADPTTGLVGISYSAVTSVTVAAVSI